MLVFNKYLKELGYTKDDFKGPKCDRRYRLQPKWGVVEAQTWCLDNTIVLELYTYLRYFQDHCPKGIPAPFIDESKPDRGKSDFEAMVEDVVDALRAYIEYDNADFIAYKDDPEGYKAKKQELYNRFYEGWCLLGRYLGCFWW